MADDIAQQMKNVHMAIEKFKIFGNDPPYTLTQQYGFMKFDDNQLDTTSRLSQYVRLSLEINAEIVVKFMQEAWKLPKPDLIISVTGGAKNCDMSARLRKIFQSGLVSAAITTNAWLITAGTNTGVVKEVGDALSNYRYKNRKQGPDVPCIGIASWGYTAGNDQLDDQHKIFPSNLSSLKAPRSFTRHLHSQVAHSVRVDIGDQYHVRNYVVKEKQKKRCDLEPNHTHFLLFDDGQTNADTVLPLRAEIEKYSRNINLATTSEGAIETVIPIVMVLVEGGPSSIRTICQALESDTPVVVIKDSGRAADLVAELHACYSEGDIAVTSTHPSRPQTGFVKGSSKDTEVHAILAKRTDIAGLDEVKNDLCRILNERRKLVTIFKFDSKRHRGNLEDAILESLFNAAKFSGDSNEQHRRTMELKLAIAWHKFGYAHKYLLTDKTISKWKEEDLSRALVDALRRGYVDFVELLIEFGTSLEKLTNGDLKQLYTTTLNSDRLPIKNKGKGAAWSKDDFYNDYFHSVTLDSKKNNLSQLNDDTPLGKRARQDLFLWAVFLDRFELATYLCSKTWNPSMAPLFGALIYRRAARLTLDLDIQQQYEENANQFDMHSMSIIDRCFDNDEHFAVDLLKHSAVAFDDVDPLSLARKADCRIFLASKCVQRYLDNEWFGHINYKRNSITFRVFLCSLFIPLIPIFCLFLPYIQKHRYIAATVIDYSRVSETAMTKDGVGYVLLVDYFPLNIYNERRSGYSNLYIPITEIILHICTWSLIIEEIRQYIFMSSRREYLAEIWNIIDIAAIIIYLIGFITRFFVQEAVFVASKIFLGVALILWYIRTLNLFAAFEKLGPKLVMILNTMKDLLFFVCFIFVFLMGFSITSWALITTNDQVQWYYADNGALANVTVSGKGSGLWTWQILRDVTNYGIWKIFGQVDPINGSDAYSHVAFVLAIIFVAIANVLLLNVLVALFNVTIQTVAQQSYRIWRYQRFLLVCEYKQKPPIPPPFTPLYYLYISIRYLAGRIQYHREKKQNANETLVMDSVELNEANIREEFKSK
ncbi:unnamed protein product [Rotaria socialis]|uniref:Uncharacterized protein n=1 Tax=Rotaria socialis TaxID=392032 RepID=A0A817VFL4_9BILA|nr:unnamed protein product [Rotaria socialis]